MKWTIYEVNEVSPLKSESKRGYYLTGDITAIDGLFRYHVWRIDFAPGVVSFGEVQRFECYEVDEWVSASGCLEWLPVLVCSSLNEVLGFFASFGYRVNTNGIIDREAMMRFQILLNQNKSGLTYNK